MTIVVRHSRKGPITLFEKGPQGEIQVRLNVRGRRWAQFAFQFAHELGHIACHYDEDEDPNEWFEESVCEATSLFVLRRMAESWKTAPPYPNWKGYAKSLTAYADDRLKEFRLGEGETFAKWFRHQEAALRKDRHLRKLNGVVAGQLLLLLEKSPEHWPALAHLNDGKASATDSFADFLRGWRSRVSEKHHAFVDRIAALFGVDL